MTEPVTHPNMEEPAADMPHKGILREEVIALRQILGYTNYVDTSISLAMPDLGSCLPGTQTKDVLLIAIDVDVPRFYHKDRIDQLLLHVGISILDTRQLPGLVGDAESAASPDKIIQNYQFAIGGSSKREFAEKASKRFLFGESEFIDRHELPTRLEGLITTRDFVTVFHGTKLDLEILHDLKIDLPLQGAYIFDTNKVAQWPLQLYYRLNLEKLCVTLNIPFALAHTAGNDAHFTLRALLMLAIKDSDRLRQVCECTTSVHLLNSIQQIALAPRPPNPEADLSDQHVTPEEARQRKAEREDKKRQDAEARLVKKAMKQARKQLRREGAVDASNLDAANEEAIRSGLFAEKLKELHQFQQLPHAAKKQIRMQQRDARVAKQQEMINGKVEAGNGGR